MRAKEFDIKKRNPNWRAMQDIRRSGAGGQHKNKKKAEKQGEVKHKGRTDEDNDQELSTRLKIDLGNIRNAEGETRREFKDKIEAAGGRLKFISKGPTGPDAYELNGKEVRWQGVKPALGNFVNVPPSTQTGAPATGSSRVPKIGDRVEFGIFNKPNTMKQGTVTKTDKMRITVKTDDSEEQDLNLANKSLMIKILNKDAAEGLTTEKQILTRIRQIMYDRKLSGTESNAGELHRLKQQLKDLRSQKSVSEGDEPDEQYLDKVISDLHKDAFGMRPDREFGREWISSSYEEKLEIYNNMLKNLHNDLDEASDWGEPREILEDVLQTLEREVEWPLTEVMDPKQVRQLLSPLIRAVNDKLLSMDESTDVPFSECPECRGPIFHESMMSEKQDACYHKVRSRYKVWPSAYASGALVQCRKKGAKNWGNKSKK